MSAALESVPDAPAEEPEAKPKQGALFEGFRVTEHRLNFGGNVLLVDADVIRSAKLGAEVEIVVRGRISSRGHKAQTDSEGNKLGATSSSTLIVQSIAAYEPDAD